MSNIKIILGDYILIKNNKYILGQGGFGSVYKGKYNGESHDKLKKGDFVAIKILSNENKVYIQNEVNIMEIIKKNPH